MEGGASLSAMRAAGRARGAGLQMGRAGQMRAKWRTMGRNGARWAVCAGGMALRSDILSHGLHHFAVGIGVASVLGVVEKMER